MRRIRYVRFVVSWCCSPAGQQLTHILLICRRNRCASVRRLSLRCRGRLCRLINSLVGLWAVKTLIGAVGVWGREDRRGYSPMKRATSPLRPRCVHGPRGWALRVSFLFLDDFWFPHRSIASKLRFSNLPTPFNAPSLGHHFSGCFQGFHDPSGVLSGCSGKFPRIQRSQRE